MACDLKELYRTKDVTLVHSRQWLMSVCRSHTMEVREGRNFASMFHKATVFLTLQTSISPGIRLPLNQLGKLQPLVCAMRQ